MVVEKKVSDSGSRGDKLQKVLAQAGYGSRRQIEQWIQQGRIKVNDSIAALGVRVTFKDRIYLDGKFLPRSASSRKVLLYHKPMGEICSRNDPEGRPDIFRKLPKIAHGRWVSVGRLDFNTSGLLLLTNDGELANRLMHPKYQIEREYAVRILGEVSKEMLQQLRDGVMLEDGMANFDAIYNVGGEGKNHWYHVVLSEGKNREVRRLWEALGVRVSRLTRVRFGFLPLKKYLRPGHFKDASEEEIRKLLQLVDMDERQIQVGQTSIKDKSEWKKR